MVTIDSYGIFFRAVVMGVGFLSILASISYLEREEAQTGEFYALILFSVVGQCIMVTAADLIMVFIGLEISSIATYILAGFLRDDRRNNEAALKYFLLGSFATAFLPRGTAWIFGSVAKLHDKSVEVIAANGCPKKSKATSIATIMAVAVALIFVRLRLQGFGRALSDVKAPDVYQGAPSPASGFMSAGPKAAAFAVFFRLFMTSFMSILRVIVGAGSCGVAHWVRCSSVTWALCCKPM